MYIVRYAIMLSAVLGLKLDSKDGKESEVRRILQRQTNETRDCCKNWEDLAKIEACSLTRE